MAVKSKTVGYIVLNSGTAMQLGQHNVLWIGYKLATAFSSRRKANLAIKRTTDYAFREGLQWDTDFRIKRLVRR